MAGEAQTWDPEPLPMRLLTGRLLPLFSGCPVTFPLGVAAMDSCLHSDPPGTSWSQEVCAPDSLRRVGQAVQRRLWKRLAGQAAGLWLYIKV